MEEINLNDIYWNRQTGMSVFESEENLEKYLDALELDIKEKGMKVLPIVRKSIGPEVTDTGKEYRVLQGHHRCEIAKRLKWKKIKCEVKHGI